MNAIDLIVKGYVVSMTIIAVGLVAAYVLYAAASLRNWYRTSDDRVGEAITRAKFTAVAIAVTVGALAVLTAVGIVLVVVTRAVTGVF